MILFNFLCIINLALLPMRCKYSNYSPFFAARVTPNRPHIKVRE